MGRREGVWNLEGYAGLDSPPPGTYDYITFGPVTLRTSDLSPERRLVKSETKVKTEGYIC